jgi:protein TonB
LIISGVVTIHLLVFLLFAPSFYEGGRSLTSESLTVNFVNLRTHQPSQRKETSIPKATEITSIENLNPRPSEESSLSSSERGGGHLSSLIARQVLHNPKPTYPLLSRKLREQGLVMIKLCVNQGGFVDEASVSKSSGFQGLDRSALATLSQWRFLPLSSALNSSSQCFQAPVHFSLEG